MAGAGFLLIPSPHISVAVLGQGRGLLWVAGMMKEVEIWELQLKLELQLELELAPSEMLGGW